MVFFISGYTDAHMRIAPSHPLSFSKPSIYFDVDHCGTIPPRRLSKLSFCSSRAHSILGENMASTPVPEADLWLCSACPQENADDHMVCRTCGEARPAARPSVRGRRSATVAKNHPAALAVTRARRAAPLPGGSGMPPEFPTRQSPSRAAKSKANAHIYQQANMSRTPGVPMATVVKEGGPPSGEGGGGLPDKVACTGVADDLSPSSSSSSGYSPYVGGKSTGLDEAMIEDDGGLPNDTTTAGDDGFLNDVGVDLEDDLFAAVTDAEASTFSFVERLYHYMERRLINEGNRKTVELAIMIEAGSLVRDRHQMKKEERERLFLSEYMNLIRTIPDSNFESAVVRAEMLRYYKGARKKEMDGGRMWRYYEDQLNEVKKFAYKFPGVSNISKLPSGTNQLRQMRRRMVLKLWKEKNPVSSVF